MVLPCFMPPIFSKLVQLKSFLHCLMFFKQFSIVVSACQAQRLDGPHPKENYVKAHGLPYVKCNERGLEVLSTAIHI